MGDITIRALDVLAMADIVFCEDKRVTGQLFKYYDIQTSMQVYNDHSDQKVRDEIVRRIDEGERVALVSDAGTPLISDPGYKLVQHLTGRGVFVTALPGANAPLTAVQLSGLPSDAFCFIGFLPHKKQARQKALQAYMNIDATIVMFESAQRLNDSLADIDALMPERIVAVTRELTKLHEEVKRGSAQEVLSYYESNPAKGEIVMLIEGAQAQSYDEDQVKALLLEALESQGTKKAAQEVAEITGWPKTQLYDMALKINKDGE